MKAHVLLAVLIASAPLAAQEHGVFVGDIDKSADACTNFFDYANGAWRAANPIPPTMDRWSRRWAAGEQSKEQLRTLLDDETKRHDWPKGSVDQQISDFYTACMDEPRINALGIQPIEPLLREIAAIKTRTGLQRMIAKLNAMEITAPFSFHSTPDNHNPSMVIAEVSPSGLGLPDRDYYFKSEERFTKAREKYREHVTKMFELAGYKHADAQKASDVVFTFEKQLAEPMLDNVARRNPNNRDHKMTFAELQKSTPDFDWTRYFDSAGVPHAALNVEQPATLKTLDHAVKTTPLPVWRTYLTWHVINFAAPHLSDPIAAQDFAFYGKYLHGQQEMKPRWKRCVEADDQLLGEALGRRYVERYFPPEAKARMVEMVTNLLSAMGDTIRALDWMGDETKKHAMEKLATFNPKVGYPDKWKDYRSVDIKPSSHWQNVAAGFKFDMADDLSLIGKPLDRGRWGMTPPTSNAYYNPLLNEIVFPAGIL
jgi:putative endopeptidase